MTDNPRTIDLNDPQQVFGVLNQRFPKWLSNEQDAIRFRAEFRWPVPFNRPDAGADEVINSIYEWQKKVWKDHTLGTEEWGDEQSFFHRWGYTNQTEESSGTIAWTIESNMPEAIAEVMGNSPMYILTVPNFHMKFIAF